MADRLAVKVRERGFHQLRFQPLSHSLFSQTVLVQELLELFQSINKSWDPRPPYSYSLQDWRSPAFLLLDTAGNVEHSLRRVDNIRLVYDENIADLVEAGLERLNLISELWHQDHNRRVDRRRHLDLGLASPDSLNNYHVHPGSVKNSNSIPCCSSQTPNIPPGRHAADVDLSLETMIHHPQSISKQSSTSEWARRVDGEHPYSPAPLTVLLNCLVDKRTLACPGGTSNPDREGLASPRIDLLDQPTSVRSARFNYRYRLREASVIALQYSRGQFTYQSRVLIENPLNRISTFSEPARWDNGEIRKL